MEEKTKKKCSFFFLGGGGLQCNEKSFRRNHLVSGPYIAKFGPLVNQREAIGYVGLAFWQLFILFSMSMANCV